MAKIGLYAGHGRGDDGVWDPGCTYGGYTEANLVLPITQAAVKYLRASGVTVYTDATNQYNSNAQIREAEAKGVDVFVSIHCDWYKAGSGTLPLYVSDKGKKLAQAMNNAVVGSGIIGTRGLCYRSDLLELNATSMPAVIFETGSIKADLSTLQSADAYGKALAKGICDYFGVSFAGGAVDYKPTKLTKIAEDGKWGLDTSSASQQVLGTTQDSIISNQLTWCRKFLPNAVTDSWEFGSQACGGSPCIKAIQRLVKATVDGYAGQETVTQMQIFLGFTGSDVDGIMGVKTVKAWQRYINSKL